MSSLSLSSSLLVVVGSSNKKSQNEEDDDEYCLDAKCNCQNNGNTKHRPCIIKRNKIVNTDGTCKSSPPNNVRR